MLTRCALHAIVLLYASLVLTPVARPSDVQCTNNASAINFNGNNSNPTRLFPIGVPVSGTVPLPWSVGVVCTPFSSGTVVLLTSRTNAFSGNMTPYGQNLLAGALISMQAKVYSGNGFPVEFNTTIPPNFCNVNFCLQARISPTIIIFGFKIKLAPRLTNAIIATTGA